MSIVSQYLSFIESLNRFKVEYMVVGGISVIFHGYVRLTNDMDIWVSTKEKNLEKLYNSLVSIDYAKPKCKEAVKFLRDKHMIKIPLENTKIELLDSFLINSDFDKSYKNHVTSHIEGVEMKIISIDDLIECKTKSSRPKDLLDAQYLEDLRDPEKLKEKAKGGGFILER